MTDPNLPPLWGFIPAPPPPPPVEPPPPVRSERTNSTETSASNSYYAMELICGITCNNAGLYDQMRAIRRIMYAWVNTPEKLTRTATVDDLPEIR